MAQWLLMIFLLENCNLLNESVQPRPEERAIPKAIEKVQAFIQEATNNAVIAKDQEIVLVLGNTGAGKSTFINYALGSKMKIGYKEDLAEHFAEPEDGSKHWAKIGNGIESQTLLPSVYTTPHSKVIYCDCPGFHDTRTEEDRLNITIAIQLMVNAAKSIKGIIVIIDPNDIKSNAISIRNISLMLSQLLQGKVNPNSILFVFNNKDANKKPKIEQLLNKIETLTKSEESKLEKLIKSIQGGKETENTRQVVGILRSISPENTLLIDIGDDFESKVQTENRLQKIVPTPKESFNFSAYDETRAEFDKQLAKILRNVTSKLIEFVETSKKINTNTELITSCESRITTYQNHLQQLEMAVLADANSTEKIVKEMEKKMRIHENKLKELEMEKQKSQQQMTTLTAQKMNLDTEGEEEILFWEDSCTSQVTSYDDGPEGGWWIFYTAYAFRCTHENKYLQYKGLPFSTLSRSIKKGEFKKEVINKDQGIYEGTFTGNEYGATGEATVSIYGKKKNKPPHKERMQEIELEIQKIQESINKYEQAMQELFQTIASTQQMIENYKNDAEKQKVKKTNSIKKAKEEIERAKREKKDLEFNNKLLGDQLGEAKAYIEDQKHLIDAISSFISQGICKESSLFTSFKEHYRLYQELKKGLLLENDIPEYLECPITSDIFHDPVMFNKCGHTFSSALLLKHLENKKSCPTCRESVSFEDIVPNITVRKQVEEFREKKLASAKKKLEEIKKN